MANRDIKLENCLLQNEEGLPHPLLKICDFGYSKADFRSAAKSQVGGRDSAGGDQCLGPHSNGEYAVRTLLPAHSIAACASLPEHGSSACGLYVHKRQCSALLGSAAACRLSTMP